MGLRARLRGLEKAARGKLAWLRLPDGSIVYYDPSQTGPALFLFAARTFRAVRAGEEEPPDPPEILRVISGLPTPEDRERAFWQVYGPAEHPFVAFDAAKFIATGSISPSAHIVRELPDEEEPPDGGGVERIGKPPDFLR